MRRLHQHAQLVRVHGSPGDDFLHMASLSRCEVAERYDAIRPGYPQALFTRLIGVAGLKANAKLLEIAPGTGRIGHRIPGLR